MTSTNAQLRAKARALLGGKIFAENWLMALVVLLIIGAISGASSTIPIATIILYGALYVGSAYVFLKLVKMSVSAVPFVCNKAAPHRSFI